LSKEASTALHCVSHWVGPSSAIPNAGCLEHGSASLNSSTTLLWLGSRLTFTAKEHSASFTNQSNRNLIHQTVPMIVSSTQQKTNKTLPVQIHCEIHSLFQLHSDCYSPER
jgi:hypothetical protein